MHHLSSSALCSLQFVPKQPAPGQGWNAGWIEWLILPPPMLHHTALSTQAKSCVGGREIAVHLTAGSNTFHWQTSNSMEIACFQVENKGGWSWQVSLIISECYVSDKCSCSPAVTRCSSKPALNTPLSANPFYRLMKFQKLWSQLSQRELQHCNLLWTLTMAQYIR